MRDQECIHFLQWALPRLHMRWHGFRKVRGQVCKRIRRRIRQLDIESAAAYRAYLQRHSEEWFILDGLLRVTISRFYRDKMVFTVIAETILPVLASRASAQGRNRLNIWSAGCGSGEEPYTLGLIWHFQLQAGFPGLKLHIVATDADPAMCRRAEQACYPYGSIKQLPPDWQQQAFNKQDDHFCLQPAYRQGIVFLVQDVRRETPAGQFDLVLCRNLALTYFDKELQSRVVARIKDVLKPGAALVLGIHENLPEGTTGFESWFEKLRIWRKVA